MSKSIDIMLKFQDELSNELQGKEKGIRKKIATLRAKIITLINKNSELKNLLRVSKCPNCDGDGGIYNGRRMTDGSVEDDWSQCQWCDERKQALI